MRRNTSEAASMAAMTIFLERFFFCAGWDESGSYGYGPGPVVVPLVEGAAALGRTASLTVSEQKKAQGTSQTTRRKKEAMAGSGATR